MCAGAIVLARITRLVYGARDPKAGACGSLAMVPQDLRLNHRAEVVPGVLAEDASLLLEQFFRAKRRATNRLET
jgi:tRNA(adenine34) deaminase